MKRQFVDCGETIKLKTIKEDTNKEESVADPLDIQHNEEYMFNRVKSLSCKYLNMTLILIIDLIIFSYA